MWFYKFDKAFQQFNATYPQRLGKAKEVGKSVIYLEELIVRPFPR